MFQRPFKFLLAALFLSLTLFGQNSIVREGTNFVVTTNVPTTNAWRWELKVGPLTSGRWWTLEKQMNQSPPYLGWHYFTNSLKVTRFPTNWVQLNSEWYIRVKEIQLIH